MSIEKIYQLNGIPELKEERSSFINYARISDDAESKLISLMTAIEFLGSSIMEASDKNKINAYEIGKLASVICSLSEVSIFYNKISHSARYLSGLKDGSGVTAK